MGKPTILLVAGFGDGPSMFDSLFDTQLSEHFELYPVHLPGFAGTAKNLETSNIHELARFVNDVAVRNNATIIIAHSVASVIGGEAAAIKGSPMRTHIALEGNLTPQDAYFSGTAADYDTAQLFIDGFLTRIATMAENDQVLQRYHDVVAMSDPEALWELGLDARRFSNIHHPGDRLLQNVARLIYVYNPANCAQSSLAWLDKQEFEKVHIKNASHWPTIDKPLELSERLLPLLL